VNSLPYGADHTQILAVLDVPDVQTLLEDEAGFYAIVIGSLPGIHRTVYVSSSIICFEAERCSVRVPSVWCHAPNRFGTVNMEDNVNIKRS